MLLDYGYLVVGSVLVFTGLPALWDLTLTEDFPGLLAEIFVSTS